jgi:hypothetical protein
MRDVVHFKAIWSILLPFGKVYSHSVYFVVILVIFFPFWYVVPRKIWQSCFQGNQMFFFCEKVAHWHPKIAQHYN